MGSYSVLIEKYKEANLPQEIISRIFYKNAQKILEEDLAKQESFVPQTLMERTPSFAATIFTIKSWSNSPQM